MVLSCSHRLLLALFFFVHSSLQQSCYFPDGTIAKDDTPCTGVTTDSDAVVPCCGPGRNCLPNRLCSGDMSDGNPSRGSCTDQSWKSDNCPQFCMKYSSGAMIFDCTQRNGVTDASKNRFYCCAGDSPQCCNNQSQMFTAVNWDFAAGSSSSAAASSTDATSLSSSGSSSASSSSSSSSTNSLSSSSSAAGSSSTLASIITKLNPVTITQGKTDASTVDLPTTAAATSTTVAAEHSESKRNWTGVGIGVGVGVAIPLLAVAIIGPLLWRRHRRHAVSEMPPPIFYHPDSASSRSVSPRNFKEASVRVDKPAYLRSYEADGAASYELDAVSARAEVPMKSPRELPGSEGERQRYRAYQPPSQ